MIDANLYRKVVQTALTGSDPVDIPPMEATELILKACALENGDPTQICVTWRRESLFYLHPVGNPRSDGGCDVGCLQLATTYWNRAPYTQGLTNPFGTSWNNWAPFNGSPLDNLRLGFRVYKELIQRADKDRSVAAGLFRAGHIDETSNSAYQIRKAEFEGIATRYDAFFNLMKN